MKKKHIERDLKNAKNKHRYIKTHQENLLKKLETLKNKIAEEEKRKK